MEQKILLGKTLETVFCFKNIGEAAGKIKVQEDSFTKAVIAAKTILKFDAAILLFVLVLITEWFLSGALADLGEFANTLRTTIIAVSLLWFAPIAVIINWFVSYGDLQSKESEFLKLKKDLIMSVALWFAANTLNFLLLNFKGWFDF